jgi:branched-chain amino acid transport system permease protein
MQAIVVALIQIVDSVALLALICSGLAVIFGMMRVINLAHGEFIMLGGFAAIFGVHAGLGVWPAILVFAPLATGLVGLIVERLIIRRLYGRMVDTMLATWGLSLFLVGTATMVFGNRVEGIAAPLGGFSIGIYSISVYDQFVVGLTLAIFAAGYAILRTTRAGLVARATMQNAEMAASLGVNQDRVYAFTFMIGSALSGLAGAVVAPLAGVVPTMGAAYVAKAFITVITGGASILVGTGASAILLGTIGTLTTFATTPVVGDVALLFAAIICLRLLPTGLTGRWFRGAP